MSVLNRWFKRTFFQGAKRTPANRDFNDAGNQSFETTAEPDRAVLRARARWLSVNSALMNNIDEAILNLAVGTGIRVQMRLDNSELNQTIEEAFHRWCKSTQWYDAQRVMLRSRMVDGEVFLYTRPKATGLEYQLLEADTLDDTAADKGIKRDAEDKPVSYRFKTVDDYGRYSGETITIPAEFIWQGFKRTRPSQRRGISEYAQAMTLVKNLDAFTQATVQSARTRASIAYVVQADGQIGGLDIEEEDGDQIQYIGDVAVHYLKRGETISKTAPGSSDTEYSQFSEVTTRSICAARVISYELGYQDASKTNYSSFRASLQKDMKRIQADQAWIEPALDLMFEKWMEIEIMSGRLKGISYQKFKAAPYEYTKKSYVTPEVITVDPLKERLADEKSVELNRTTQSMLAHRAGQDFENIIKIKSQEQEILDKYGMTVDPETGDLNGDSGNVTDKDAINATQGDRAIEALMNLAEGGSADASDALEELAIYV